MTLALATPAWSARSQSAYVPLDDVAYAYIDALLARGELDALSTLDRPYTARAIRAAVTSSGEFAATRALRDRLLRTVSKFEMHGAPSRAIPGRRQIFRAQAAASLWVTGETSGRRELMLADDADPAAFAGGEARLLATAGPVVAFSRPIFDNRLNTDPEFAGRKDRRIAGRTEDAYVAGQFPYGELFFGRVGRNWGPHAMHGLLLSSSPYTYDHLFGRLGTSRLNLELVVARLNTDTSGTGPDVQRYLAAHRLAGRWRWLEAAVSESFVYSGAGRGFEPSLANPLAVYGLTWRNERIEGNLLVSGELAARTGAGILSAQLLIDDLQIDRCDTVCQEPSSYALTLAAEGIPVAIGQRAFVSYTKVTSLTYRTPTSGETYAMLGVGLGRGYSDYDEWRLGADVVVAAAPLRLYYALRRQGEGDYRKPFPPTSSYATQPLIFEGAVTRVHRVGVTGGAVVGDFDLRGDVGYNSVSDPPSVTADAIRGFEGRVRLSWNPRWAVLTLAP